MKKKTEQIVDEIKESTKKEIKKEESEENFSFLASTGSTRLDLAISGGRRHGGGIPGGILVEIFGKEGLGKTSILSEIATSVQKQGGNVKILDPEGRLDKEYALIYGLALNKENYSRPNTVGEFFKEIWDWEVIEGVPNLIGADSIAAFSTEEEMESEDKMGMKRAKDFSEGLRKTCRLIAHQNRLVVCTNQVRQNPSVSYGTTYKSTGGNALPFYSSLRLKVSSPPTKSKIEKEITRNGKKFSKTLGINTIVEVVKSTIDDPYREVPISILFGYGIDDIRDNLQYLKDVNQTTTYEFNGENFRSMEAAIHHIEDKDLQLQLKEKVINAWEEIEALFKVKRKIKIR